MKKIFSLMLVLCLALSSCGAFAAETPNLTDMIPEMNLIAAASQYSANAPESVPGEEGKLSSAFVEALLLCGQKQSAEVGITTSMLTDPEAQTALLSSMFAAALPETAIISASDEEYGFIGFDAQKVYVLENGDYQVIGGLYSSQKAIHEMSGYDFTQITWFENGIFVLRKDDTAKNGYRIMGFSVGTDLSYEEAFQNYLEEIAVEYTSQLGFSFLFPATFEDDSIVENESEVTAKLADGTASFAVSRMLNESKTTLADYTNEEAAAHENAVVTLNEGSDYSTIFYMEGGYATFTKIFVTEDYVYQAELCCAENLLADYSLFFTFLENSFVVNELSQG